VLVGASALLAAGVAGAWFVAQAPGPDGKAAEPKRPAALKRANMGQGVFLETQGPRRRVIVEAEVVLRDNSFPLEGLLTRARTKEYEYILATEADARQIHAALLAAGAQTGSPARTGPKYQPASGSVIKIALRYEQDGKPVTVPAQRWLRHLETHEDLERDWVFVGSFFCRNPGDPCQVFYLANDGNVACICDMPGAMLTLPVKSPTKLSDRDYEPHTERIPPLGTKVEVIMEPVNKP
jgi:hypothetical protein